MIKNPVWRTPLLMLLAVWGLVLVLYWPTASAMATIWWRSDTYGWLEIWCRSMPSRSSLSWP